MTYCNSVSDAAEVLEILEWKGDIVHVNVETAEHLKNGANKTVLLCIYAKIIKILDHMNVAVQKVV